MYYITFNDTPSGIYQSQVIDVVKYLSDLGDIEVQLIAFLPYSNFKENKKKIKIQLPNATVLPIWAGITRWRKVKPLLRLLNKRNGIAICRGPIATELSLGCFRKVVYDGRAAVKAEVEEFDVTGNKQLGEDFIKAEKNAVLKSDYRIAVSTKLVKYWQNEFGYLGDKHIVIPCTLTSKASGQIDETYNREGIKLVYSGGAGPWQSFDLVTKLIREKLKSSANISVLFLTKENKGIDDLIKEFPERCERKWLDHCKVFSALSCCDYGILIRDQNLTNKVASPVKFAEYLNAGLKVLISENLGDFTQFVKKNNCGEIVGNKIEELKYINKIERKRLNRLSKDQFSKSSKKIQELYLDLINSL
jgi:hypothetical protein